MHLKRLLCIMVMVFATLLSVYASQTKIVGQVTDANGKTPLLGVTVTVKGTSRGVATGNDGKYTIMADPAETLVFSYVGLNTLEIKVGTRSLINVEMKADISIDEVVVVGYGLVKKSDLTGSVASVKADELLKNNPVSVEQGMQGRLAGVHITQNDGAPGGGISMQIRGTNSFMGGTEPLYVIDGVPLSTSNGDQTVTFDGDKDVLSRNALSFLSPGDIESIEVLKDGSSIAIYGSKGANGVVMITTKSGKAGRDNLDVNYSLSVGAISNKMEMLGGRDYALYQNDSYRITQTLSSGSFNPDKLPYPGKNNDKGEYEKGPDDYDNNPYYWQDVIFQTAVSQDLNLTYSGSSKGFNYSVGGSYLDQKGIVLNSGFKRTTFKVALSKQVKSWIELGTSTNLSFSTSKMMKAATQNQNNGDEGVIRSALYFPSTYTVDSDVTLGEFSTVVNPTLYTEALNQNKNYNIYSSNFATIKIAKGLIFKTVLGYNLSINNANRYFPRTMNEGMSVRGVSQAGDNTWQSLLWDNMFMYNRTLGKHNINATLATSWEESDAYSKKMSVEGFGVDSDGWILSEGTKANIPSSSKWNSRMFSYIMRAAYGYDNRYLLTLTMRRDASSKFAANHKAAYFPSVGLAWRASEEEFMRDSKVFSNLKVRYSWGASGNSAIGAYGSLAQFTNANYPFGGNPANGYAPDASNVGNPNLKWETTYQHDAGVDVTLFGRVDVTFDYYHKLTEDLLQYKSHPSSSGIVHVLTNLGSVKNKGIELTVNANIIRTPNFSWNVGANFSRNRNELVKIGDYDGELVYPNKFWNDLTPFVLTNGKPIGQLYGYIEEGLWNSREEVINSKQFQTAYPGYKVSDNVDATEKIISQKWVGEVRLQDKNDSGTITDADMDFIGDVNPDFTYGLNMDFKYKNFDFSFLFSGVQGNDIINMNTFRFHNTGGGRNIPVAVHEEIWTAEKGGTVPKNYYDTGRKLQFSRRFIEDGSYLKLRNITLGYTFRNPLKGISSLRVTFSANNLFTITNYSGYDPEVNAFGSDPSMRGVDAGGYPYSRTFNFGVNLSF